MAAFQLAQINIASMRGPIDGPVMKGFVDLLDEINALADASPGFVWRLQSEEGDATSIRAFDDDMLLINLSVWESVEALKEFVYRTGHLAPLRRRAEWFGKMATPYQAMWWVPAGHQPSTEEAKRSLEHLTEHGPGPSAFDFRTVHPPPSDS